MAFGFIKKVFSFGKNRVDDVSAESGAPETRPPEEQPATAPLEPRQPETAPQPGDILGPLDPKSVPPSPELPIPERPVEAETKADEERHLADNAGEFLAQSTPAGPGVAPAPSQPADPDMGAIETGLSSPDAQTPTETDVPPGEPEVRAAPADPQAADAGSSVTEQQPALPDVQPTLSGRVTVARNVEQKAAPPPEPVAARQSWFQRLRGGLSRSSKELGDNLAGIFTKGRLTEEIVEELEEVLIRADLGMETAMRVTDALESGRYGRQTTEADVRAVMASEIAKMLAPVALPLELDLSVKPHVILVVGVNGTGKTTTIGKLAAKLVSGGLGVTLAAGDTFRAAAIEQLRIWGERTGSPVISSKLGADAAGLAYEAFEKAKAAGSDVLIIDTAGRLQNKTELMAELEKIVRVLRKLDPDAPHTVLQTVDATTGQNAMNQVDIFRNVAGVNGLVLTKLDGTARGGILVAIAARHRLPVYFIGVGEQVDDLEPFSADEFARAIAGVA